MRAGLAITGVAAAAIGLSGCVIGDLGPMDRFHTDFHYSYPVDAKARIDAESFNGPIEIEGWDKNEVEISGVKSASSEEARDAIKIDVHNTRGSVDIRAIKPSSLQGNMGVQITMHVPRNAEVDRVTTSNGPIKVRDVNRAAHLKSSNGGITLTGVSGEVDAHTSNGPIDAESLTGPAVLKTSNGHIHAENINGSLEAETSNGGIKARFATSPPSPIKLITSNNSIELTMEKAPQGDIHAETRNNSITLHLPADTSARVLADTSNSSIETDFAISGDKDKHHLSGTIGSAAHNIELNTSNGHIRIGRGI